MALSSNRDGTQRRQDAEAQGGEQQVQVESVDRPSVSLKQLKPTVLPQNPLDKAVGYALAEWKRRKLFRFESCNVLHLSRPSAFDQEP